MLPEAPVFNSHVLIVFKCMQIWRQQLSIWMVLSWIGHKLDSTPNQTKSKVAIWVWWNRSLACFSESNSNNYMWKSAPICLWSNLLLCPITSPCSGLTSVTQVRLYQWVTLSTGLILDICCISSMIQHISSIILDIPTGLILNIYADVSI